MRAELAAGHEDVTEGQPRRLGRLPLEGQGAVDVGAILDGDIEELGVEVLLNETLLVSLAVAVPLNGKLHDS